MEKLIDVHSEAEERDKLPLSPIAFGSGAKTTLPVDGHLLLSVREGEVRLLCECGEEELSSGMLLFIRRGVKAEFLDKSDDFECEYILFDAGEDFLSHLELSDVSVGEVGEGAGISSVVRMSSYALEYYHDRLRICASVYFALAKIARDCMISRLERFDTLSERLSPAILQIEQRYSEPLTVKILAHSCSMSESFFSRSFKRVYGCTPVQYLINVRIVEAKKLLADTELSFEEIAGKCGFKSAKYFGDTLKKTEHITPRELRSMYRGMTQIKFF